MPCMVLHSISTPSADSPPDSLTLYNAPHPSLPCWTSSARIGMSVQSSWIHSSLLTILNWFSCAVNAENLILCVPYMYICMHIKFFQYFFLLDFTQCMFLVHLSKISWELCRWDSADLSVANASIMLFKLLLHALISSIGTVSSFF